MASHLHDYEPYQLGIRRDRIMIFPPDIRYDDTDDDYERKMVDIWDLEIW